MSGECAASGSVLLSVEALRHTRGMHLLQGGVSLDIIRDFLSHVDIKTTDIYVRANLEGIVEVS